MKFFYEQNFVINQTVFSQGDFPNSVFLVLNGTFETYRKKKTKK